MKLRVILVLVMAMSVLCPLSGVARDVTVNLDVGDVTIKELLHLIESQSSYTFAYSDSDIPVNRRVTVRAHGRTLRSIMAEVLPGVSMEVRGMRIVLTADAMAENADKAADTKRMVAGLVTDESGEPLPGATVIVTGSPTGTATDVNGRFRIMTDDDVSGELTVSFVGYNTVKLPLNGDTGNLKVRLSAVSTRLNDVVVVGYGVQNKRDVTTSIASIKSKELSTSSTADFRDAMAARMSGVQVLTLGGNPDGNVAVRVRGIQSATSGNDPLYVIDGVICDSRAFANIEVSDIESLEVLKDASAAAIYGSRGSCGVVIVTTKRGHGERQSVRYDGMVGFSNVSRKMDLLNAYEWASMFKEARDGAFLAEVPGASIDVDYSLRPQGYHRVDPLVTAYLTDRTGALTDTDWQDEIFRTALTTKHAVSVTGSAPALNYYAGVNYLYREGTIINSDFERFGVRVNLDGRHGRFRYGLSLSPSYSVTNHVDAESQYNHDGIIATALMCPPVFPVYDATGAYCWKMNGYLRTNLWDTQCTEVLNPVAMAMEITDRRKRVNVMGNVYAGLELARGLEYKVTLGGDYYAYRRNYYRPSYIEAQGYRYFGALTAPTATANSNNYYHWAVTNQISYDAVFGGDHRLNAVAVYEAEKQTANTVMLTGKGTPGDDKVRTTKGVTIDPAASYDEDFAYTFASWLLRASYSYKGRYMLSASIRGDGSSRFAPNTRWGYFPAASAGWRMSEESFMRGLSWIDSLKLRLSVGQTGNAQIGNFEYLSTYNHKLIDLGNGNVTQYYPSEPGNSELGWEKNTQYNVGADMSLWNGYLGLSADVYYSKTTDMLFDVPVVSVSGHTTNKVNIGSMQNRGVELLLTSRHGYGDFSYGFSANWSLNRNKVLTLGDSNADIIKTSSYSGAYYITRVGEPAGCYYLLVQDGIFHNSKELDSYPHFDETRVGDFRFVDVNGNGVMEQDADRAIVGNYMPDFYYGFSVNLAYKGFDLSSEFQGVYGNEILNLERRYLLNMEASSNMMRESLQRWPYGELNRATRKSTGRNGASTSTFHLEDGSYLRLQRLSVGYTLPQAWSSRLRMSKLRVYVQGTNLFTWTKYTGYNPEVNRRASDALTPGEDYCSYPLSRTFCFGLNFTI